MTTIKRPGAQVYYEKSGAGPVVVLGHSLLCDGRMWDEVVAALARDFTVINTDFRGHRNSTTTRAYRLSELADDWLAILDHEGIERAALCGLSMGGMAAMRAAVTAPERVAGLVLLDSNADRDDLIGRLRFRVMAQLYRRLGLFGGLERKIAGLMLGRTTLRERPEIAARLGRWMREQEPRQLVRAIHAVVGRRSISAELAAIECPTMILVGQEDLATPPACSRHLHAAIAGSTLELIAGAGHLTALETPAPVIARMQGFLPGCNW